jgi:site-specific DNA-methyltransferase (adenine-specific)
MMGRTRAVDGVINFVDDSSGKPKRVIIQVKSGNVNRGLIAALKGDVEREKAAMGVFITLDEPTAPMISEAVSAGYYSSPDYYGTGEGKKYPRIQVLTIEQLMSGTQVQMPPPSGTFRQAQQVKQSEGEQLAFDVE